MASSAATALYLRADDLQLGRGETVEGHGAGALPLPRRDHDPHLRAGRGRGAGRARVGAGHQRPDRRRAPLPGARRPADDPGAARPPRGREGGLRRRRQQRLRLAHARRRPSSGCGSSAATPAGLRAGGDGGRARAAPRRVGRDGRADARPTRRRRAAQTSLYTDVWTSMGQDAERERRLQDLAGFGIDARAGRARPRPTRS